MERVLRGAEARPGSPTATSRPATSASIPNIRYANNQPPKLIGYTASNQLTIRFRDIANSGKILDALVAEGANQINGPNLTIDKPEAALDEARAQGRRRRAARAPTSTPARSGCAWSRVVSVSESGGYAAPPPMPMMMASACAGRGHQDRCPASRSCRSRSAMTFELQ